MAPYRIFQANKHICNNTIYYSSAVTCPEAILYQNVFLKNVGLGSIWRGFDNHVLQDLEVANKATLLASENSLVRLLYFGNKTLKHFVVFYKVHIYWNIIQFRNKKKLWIIQQNFIRWWMLSDGSSCSTESNRPTGSTNHFTSYFALCGFIAHDYCSASCSFVRFLSPC